LSKLPIWLKDMLALTLKRELASFMIALVLLAFAFIIWLEAPGLVKKKMWRELAAFSVFLIIGMALTIPQVYGIRPFEPNAPIETLFKPLAELLKKP